MRLNCQTQEIVLISQFGGINKSLMLSKNQIEMYEEKMGDEIRQLYWRQQISEFELVRNTLQLYFKSDSSNQHDRIKRQQAQLSQNHLDWIQAIEHADNIQRELHKKRGVFLVALENTLNTLRCQLFLKISQNAPPTSDSLQIQPSQYSMDYFLNLNQQLHGKVSSQLLFIHKIRKQLSEITNKIHALRKSNLKKVSFLYQTKNNLQQYLACLQKLKVSLHQYQHATNETDLQSINKQISLNGFQIAPDLFEKYLCRLCSVSIYQKGIQLRISKWRNLQIIVNSFMVPATLEHQQSFSHMEPQGLYNLCKNFLKLRTLLIYIDSKQQYSTSQIGKLCLPKISGYISKFSQLISKKEFWKVQSLCQSNKQLLQFIQILFHQLQHINETQLDTKLSEFERRLSIIKKGQTVEGFQCFMEEFQQEEFIRFYKKVEEKAWVYNEQMAGDIFYNLILGLLRILYFPLLYMIFIAIAGEHDTKQARRYQKIRLMHNHIETYHTLFKQINETQQKNLKSNNLNPKLPKPISIKSIKNGAYLKQLSNYVKEKTKQFKMNYKQINNAAVDYNQKFGGTVLFLINKLAVLRKSECEKSQKEIRDKYIELWVEMVAELCFDALKFSEKECRYPLKDLKFFKEKILASLQSKFITQTKMDSIFDFFRQKENKMKKKPNFLSIRKNQVKEQEKFKQKLYSEIMSVNIRTCQYDTLMKMAKFIGEEIVSELTSGHRSFYYSIFK